MRRYYIGIVTIFTILGCTGGDSSQKVGYLITPSRSDIYYKCGNQEANLKEDGKFNCLSFPISFYIDGNEIGSISSIHSDGFVFPQDMERITIASFN